MINASIGGALIKGFDTNPLDKTMQDYAKTVLDKEKLLNLLKPSTTNQKTVLANIKNDYQILKNVIIKLEKGIEILEKNKNKDINSFGELSQLTAIFQEITQKYMLKTRIIKIILFKEFIELDYIAREYQDIDTIETAKLYLDAYNNYFQKGLEKSNIVLKFLKNIQEKMENK